MLHTKPRFISVIRTKFRTEVLTYMMTPIPGKTHPTSEFGRVNPLQGSRLCSVPEKFLNDANEHLTSERS